MIQAVPPSAPMISWRWIAVFWSAGAVFEATQSVFIQHVLGKSGGEVLLFLTEVAAWLRSVAGHGVEVVVTLPIAD